MKEAYLDLTPTGPQPQVIYLPAQNMIEADYNPRLLTTKQAHHLTESLLLFGFIDPTIINSHPSRSGIIVGGHQRRRLAMLFYADGVSLVDEHGSYRTYPVGHPYEGQDIHHGPGFVLHGCQETEGGGLLMLPTTPVYLELEREKELNLRLNRNHGEFDKDILANHYEAADLLAIGFSEVELGLSSWEPSDSTSGSGSDDSPDGPAPGKVKPMTPHFIINFATPEDAQLVHSEVQELLDRLLPDSPAVIVVRGMGDDGNGPAQAGLENETEPDPDTLPF